MRYLRFGEIPKSGKSINFFKLTYAQNEDFTYMCETGEVERAFDECVPPSAYEKGLSVFEMDSNGLPVLRNLQLVSSLLLRLEDQIYEVSGIEVGKGNDEEPLITDVKIEKKRLIKKEKLVDLALSTMLKNFKTATYNQSEDYKSNKLFNFCSRMKINKRTGEKVDLYEETKGTDWVKCPAIDEYCFNGWTFSDPVNEFPVTLGLKKDRSIKETKHQHAKNLQEKKPNL